MELNLSEPGQSRYLRVYEYYKELIVSGQMKPGAKPVSYTHLTLPTNSSEAAVDPQMFPAAAAFTDDGGDGVYAAGGGWLYHFASAERVLCNGCGAGGCKPGGNRAWCAASGGTPGNPV